MHVGGDPHEIPAWNASLGPDVILEDGAVHEVAVAYFPGELSVYVDDLTRPRLTVPLSLGAHGAAGGDGAAWVGFTAATAVAFESHEVTRFSMSSVGAAACGESIVVEPGERRSTAVDLGATSGTFILRSDALAGRARTLVRYEGQVIHDTGCSDLARATVPVHFAGSSTVVTTESWTCGGALGPTGHSVGCLRSPGALVTGADTDSAPEEIAAVPQNVRPPLEMYVGRLGQANDLVTSRCDLAVDPRNCTDIVTGQTCTKPCNYEGAIAQSVGAASAYAYWFLRGPLDLRSIRERPGGIEDSHRAAARRYGRQQADGLAAQVERYASVVGGRTLFADIEDGPSPGIAGWSPCVDGNGNILDPCPVDVELNEIVLTALWERVVERGYVPGLYTNYSSMRPRGIPGRGSSPTFRCRYPPTRRPALAIEARGTFLD